VARLAKRYNTKTVMGTNGYMTSDAIKKIGKYLDAVTVDIKASGDPEFYKKYMGVDDVEPIFSALKSYKKHRVFIEISNLIVPEIGENRELNKKLLDWVINNLGSTVPYHLSSFTPAHKMLDVPETTLEKLENFAMDAKRVGLRYIYIDSEWGGSGYENTYCYNCGTPLIERTAFMVNKINLVHDRCPNCRTKIDLVIE
jgi:pyruvate formate lyase activating enzyme